MNTPLRLGLLGAGRIGQVHAAAITSEVSSASLTYVVDSYAPSAESLGQQYQIPYSTDPQDIFGNPDIDAVLICSSTDTHAPFMISAAEAGKHIFCEKPIDHDLGRIDEALAAVEKSGVKLMIGFNRRFDHNFMKLQQMIADGRIGEQQILQITSRDPAPPPVSYIEVSGGLFMDMMIHDFDMARFLFGDIDEVYALGAVMVDPAIGEAGDVDTAVVTLKFKSGAIGSINNSRQAVYGYDQRVEAFGSKGMVNVKNDYPNTHTFYGEEGVVSEKPLYFFLERYMDAYKNEMKAFVDCVVNDKPSPATGQDGRESVVVAMAALKSLKEKRPVKVSEIA